MSDKTSNKLKSGIYGEVRRVKLQMTNGFWSNMAGKIIGVVFATPYQRTSHCEPIEVAGLKQENFRCLCYHVDFDGGFEDLIPVKGTKIPFEYPYEITPGRQVGV
jgi:hypothetical protein